MKTKVTIQDGETNIELTPENSFEADVLKKVSALKDPFRAKIDSTYNRGNYDYKLLVNLSEKVYKENKDFELGPPDSQ